MGVARLTMISHKHKFIFIHIPKTGGTSVEIALEDETCICKRNEWSKEPRGFGAPLNHLTLQQVIDSKYLTEEQLQTYFKFTFIRHPLDRAISEIFCPHIKGVFKKYDNVKDKLIRLSTIDNHAGHIKPQIKFIKTNCDISMDFIGKFENFQEDFNVVCDKIGIPQRDLPHKNKNKTKTKHYTEYYDEVVKDLIRYKYKQDLKMYE